MKGVVGCPPDCGEGHATYEALYAEHADRVHRLCRLLLADRHEAEEVAQEVFIKLYQACDQSIAWGPWLTRVTINACRDRRRSGWWKWWRRSGEELAEDRTPSPEPTPEEARVGREIRDRIWTAFRRLSSRQREIFALRHLEGRSTQEVAKLLGLSTGSVKRHLFRAVNQLRAAVGEAE